MAAAFTVPDRCSAQQASAPGQDTVRIPIVEGRDIRFRKLSNPQNLSHVRVESIVQDTQGFMWFGTWNGLNRYDGYKFKVFKHETGDPKSLSGVYVYSLFKDRSGNLWVGTDGFLDRFHPETESFTHYKLDKRSGNELSSIVTHISEDSSGRLWLSTRNGLFRLDPNSGELKNYVYDPADPLTLADNDVQSTGEDREGNFWVATSTTLDEFDRQTGKVKRHIPVGESGIGLWFHEDRSGVFWVIYGSLGYLATLDRKTNRLTRFDYEWKVGPPQENQAYSMLEDSNGTMWFGTASAGLMKFDRQNRCFVGYRHDPADPETIGDNHVIALFEDREGNIWAGLHQEEPNYFPIRPLTFENLTRLMRSSQYELSGLVTAIYQEGRDEVWLGANRRLYHVNRKTGEVLPFKGVDNSVVYSIIPDGPDVLWFGNAYPGLLRYNAKTGERRGYRHNPNDPTTLCSGVTSQLLIDSEGALWAATWDGLCQLNSSTNRFTKYTPAPGSRGLNYFVIAQAPDGALWLGGNLGLHRFDPQTKTFNVYTHNPEDPTSISDDHVNAVFFDGSGSLWAGTQNGLDKFEPVTRTFKSYDQRYGISGTVVSCILEDGRGTLWMGTNTGISSFNTKTEHFANYTSADGLPGPDLTGTGACYKSSRGEMFFAGFSGATAFFPDKVGDNPYVPRHVLTDFRLFGSSVIPGRRSPLKVAINRASAIQLSHSENIFSIEFSALSYLNPETNRYRYKLDGIDKGWREVGSDERLATYTTLPAGNYTFRLEAATSRGPWSPDVTLAMKISPPFWQTYWFLTCCAAALCGILTLLYRLHIRTLSAQFHMRTEERVGERTRIARELHDTLLQSFQGLMLRLQVVDELLPDGKAKEQLEQTLTRADQAIAEGRSAVYDLRSSAITGDLAQAVRALGNELATQDSTTFRLVVEGPPREMDPIVRDELYRITREAIRNAFSHARAHQIEVEITYAGQLFRLRIRDDGVGIAPQFLAEGRPGHYGITGIRERARQIGAKLSIWSGAGAGTEIELSIPASNAYDKSPKRSRWRAFRQKVG
ncbi:MAG TPA: two-component regulator propeller domain-containing protein [Bryobacteraceae bacterium]|nr:two-component regulator propeller domain-containing protein [Bryobacteraceae bacterium]